LYPHTVEPQARGKRLFEAFHVLERVLADAVARLLGRYPNLQVLMAGQYQHVLGEEAYARYVLARVDRFGPQWRFLGVLPSRDLAAFYAALDVLVVASVNSTESFGMVQVEAMMCSTPCVATDLPGVRQPVLQTGMGRIARRGDANSLAEAIAFAIEDRKTLVRPRTEVSTPFAPERTAHAYANLFASSMGRVTEWTGAAKENRSRGPSPSSFGTTCSSRPTKGLR
jgi:glycosyltransferase involved in cell wall biosynthesis